MFSNLKISGVLAMVLVTLVLLTLFFSLRSNLNEKYDSYNNAVCINTASTDDIAKALIENNYVKNESDANFIAKTLRKRMDEKGSLGSLFDIRNNNYRATVQEIENSNSEAYKTLYRQMCDELEQSDSIFVHTTVNQSEIKIDPSLKGEIKISVWEKDTAANFIQRAIKHDRKPCANIYVRLNEHSSNNREGVTIASIKTDINGEGYFKGLNDTLSYSVLPIAVGYKYGNAKGTVHSVLKNAEGNYSFEQSPITVPLLSLPVLRQIKDDSTIVVRTLSDFTSGLSSRFLGIVIFWWCFFIFSSFLKRPLDSLLTSALLGLTGLCCLIMHSLNNPLTDTLLGEDVIQGIGAGCFVILLLQFVNPVTFYQDRGLLHFDFLQQSSTWLCSSYKNKLSPFANRLKGTNALVKICSLLAIVIFAPLSIIVSWLCMPYKRKVKYVVSNLKSGNMFVKCICLLTILLTSPLAVIDLLFFPLNKLSKGIGYLIIAILLTALLFVFGSEVGGMKVNLNLFGIKFQPSEIAKYLFVIFMAAFFCQNADKIIALDSIGKAKLFWIKMKNLFVLLLGFGTLMALYVILQDLGPAMVIIFTFIILYSIIKSKDKIDKIGKVSTLREIFSCDFAVLCYGIISFLIAFYIGNKIEAPGIACLAWFAIWIGVGFSRFKQVHETSILFNIVLCAFIFGGSLKGVPDFNICGWSAGADLNKIGERLDSRTAMCSNTWGILGINGAKSEATTNSQVADGLWGLATGGWKGQGLSNGECSLIPAFNTDMILESIGAQIGYVGLVFVLLLCFLLFRRALVVGYRSNHPFTFYLCVGVAIVTAVQFAIIALGSTGVIPLTGITVPLLSYGKVSMILNLFAFGLVLTVSSHNTSVPSKVEGVKAYNNSMSLLTYSFLSVLVVIGITFFYYQWIDRNATLIRPVLAKDASGIVSLKYNPRIAALVDKMRIGNIYDRNGVLLATSNKDELAKFDSVYAQCNITYNFEGKQKRYYPFGEHLFFMVGDYNTKLFFSGKDRGLLAENKYLETLRGYDNRLIDQNGEIQYVYISSSDIYENRFLEKKTSSDTVRTVLRDYSALIPYLKDGVNGERINDFNNNDESSDSLYKKIEPADVHLSVDAVLQTELQNEIKDFISKEPTLKRNKKLRASAVILDTNSGKLLSSANYPTPNIEQLLYLGDERYSDYKISEAYSDMDLGLFYATQPGSTAKVMSALSSLMKDSLSYNFVCSVSDFEKPSPDSFEPKYGNGITMETAIKLSSNVYFIKLINENNTYEELCKLFSYVGILVNRNRPYDNLRYHTTKPSWTKAYKEATLGERERFNRIKNHNIKSKEKERFAGGAFNFAWGQWPMEATPLSMAKVAAIVANNGELPDICFSMDDERVSYSIIDSISCSKLNHYMKLEAREHTSCHISDYNASGKTGTVLRPDASGRRYKDAWYICFCDKKGGGKIAIALRIERAKMDSPIAKRMVRDVVLKTLDEMGYISKSKES